MTVKELRDRLSHLDDKTQVVVYWENGNEQHCFGIDDVSLKRGTPTRLGSGKAAFAFDAQGLVSWLFIVVSPEE